MDRVYLRLDRAFATLDWLEHFCNLKVHHLVNTTSDHYPLLLTEASSLRCNRERRFHFEALWTTRADYKNVIEEVWNNGSNLGAPSGLAARLKQCSSALSSWSMGVYGHIPKKIEEKKKYLQKLTVQDRGGQNGVEINKLKEEINELLDGEEVWRQQRLRVQWLGEGDRNTKYFHNCASERRRKNTISGLWNENGIWCESKESVAATAISNFENIYTTTNPT